MSKPRKTVRTAEIVDSLNANIAASKEVSPENVTGRMALCHAIESVLMLANAYGGFRYLDGHEAVIAGTHDESARHYYVKAGAR